MFDIHDADPLWGFMPVVHTYDNLVKSFEDRGYKKNRDFFIVFYDWRQDTTKVWRSF